VLGTRLRCQNQSPRHGPVRLPRAPARSGAKYAPVRSFAVAAALTLAKAGEARLRLASHNWEIKRMSRSLDVFLH
jgi:hypothetical protein